VAQLLAIDRARVESGHVPGEVEVLFGPVANHGQLGAERIAHDVVRVPDIDRAVAHARVARYLLDHLLVVVGG
jgi:hypothetical protein